MQSRARGVDRRLGGRTSLGLMLAYELHDEYLDLGGEADQNHETDPRQDVDRHAAEQ